MGTGKVGTGKYVLAFYHGPSDALSVLVNPGNNESIVLYKNGSGQRLPWSVYESLEKSTMIDVTYQPISDDGGDSDELPGVAVQEGGE